MFASARMIACPWRHCQELAEGPQHVILLDRFGQIRTFPGDHEWNRVHPEAGNAELQPEAHDLENLGLDSRIRGIKVRLKLIESVEIGTRPRPYRASR